MDLNYDDLQYQGISDIKHTLDIINIDSYYEPELIASAFDKHYERYRINGDKDKELSLNAYFNAVRQNVVELITKKNIGERKVQLVISAVFINYLNNENAEKYAYNDNIVIRTADDSNKITTNLYNSLKHKFQETLENKMQGSSFVFDYVNFLDLKFNKVDLIRGGTYIETPKWISNKKATINPKNDKDNDNNCFMYAITVAFNHQEIGCHPERISKIKQFINNYNWKNIDFPSQRNDWERFERSNDDIALNNLSVPFN